MFIFACHFNVFHFSVISSYYIVLILLTIFAKRYLDKNKKMQKKNVIRFKFACNIMFD